MRFSTIFPGTFKWFWPFSVSFCWNLFTAVLSWNLKIPSFTQKVFWLTYNYTLSMQSTCFLFEIIIVFHRYSNYFYPTINRQKVIMQLSHWFPGKLPSLLQSIPITRQFFQVAKVHSFLSKIDIIHLQICLKRINERHKCFYLSITVWQHKI